MQIRKIRAKAARLIGEMSHTLDGEDREFAKQALNRAMADPDPSVLMTVMNAMGQFPAVEVEDEYDIEEEHVEPEKAESCAVCGKPVALVDPENTVHTIIAHIVSNENP